MTKEDIFNKPQQDEEYEVIKKPKRKLTEKQLSNLAKGRERMKIKREEAKKKKEKKDVIQGEKEHIKIKTENIKKKRKTMKEITEKKEQSILEKLQQKEKKTNKKQQSLENLFHKLKVDCLSQAKSVREYTEIKESLDGVTGEILMDDVKLKEYVEETMKPFLQTIEEENEE
tara:strand:- start:524 stop:1039 length:516 start_codon:yes stop_codon:yes gene_type:complete